MNHNPTELKQLLALLVDNWQSCHPSNNDEVYRLLYRHLYQLSKKHKAMLTAKHPHQQFNQVYSTTTVVHELYYRIKKGEGKLQLSEKSMIKLVTDMTRHIIFDLAKKINTQKYQAQIAFENATDSLELHQNDLVSDHHKIKLIMLNKALDKLATTEPLWVEAFGYKYFGNLSEHQIADLLECTRSKVRGYLEKCRHWLADYC